MQLAPKRDGTPEAHAEAPLVMSRILERRGRMELRGARLADDHLPVQCGLRAVYVPGRLTRLPNGAPIDLAYQWVFAPPFQVIDMTIQSCRYPYPFNHLLPKTVWEQNAENGRGRPGGRSSAPARCRRSAATACRPRKASIATFPITARSLRPIFPATRSRGSARN